MNNFYGGLNEFFLGVRSRPPEAPEILAFYQMQKEFGVTLKSGGLEDQPYLWVIAMNVVINVSKTWEAILDVARQNQAAK